MKWKTPLEEAESMRVMLEEGFRAIAEELDSTLDVSVLGNPFDADEYDLVLSGETVNRCLLPGMCYRFITSEIMTDEDFWKFGRMILIEMVFRVKSHKQSVEIRDEFERSVIDGS